MLKKERSLKWELLAWIVSGILILVVAPLYSKDLLCSPKEPYVRAVKSDRQSGGYQNNSNEIKSIILLEKEQPQKKDNESNSNNLGNYSPSWLCEEIKLTDILIAFFTYRLVIIGWFGIRSSERSTRQLERPYIFGTPELFAVKSDTGNWLVHVLLQNYGRGPGTVEAIYGEVSLTEPSGKPIYAKGSRRTAGGMISPTKGKPIEAPVTFECPVKNDFYFFGYVTYSDLFRETHTSRFCAKIFLNTRGIEAAGTDAFHDWN